jgi:glycosyl transferase family 25
MMERWLCGIGFDWARSDGVLYESDGVEVGYDRTKRVRRFGYDLTNSEIGCFLAHQKVWRECVELSHPMLVLESDMLPATERLVSVLDCLDSMLVGSDMIRLHGIFENNEIFSRLIQQVDHEFALIQSIGDPMGAGAYVVSPFGARKLLEMSKSFFQPVDVFLGSTWLHGLRYRTIKPYPLKAAQIESEIGERRRPKQSVWTRLSIESHRFCDDVRRILHMPVDYFR